MKTSTASTLAGVSAFCLVLALAWIGGLEFRRGPALAYTLGIGCLFAGWSYVFINFSLDD